MRIKKIKFFLNKEIHYRNMFNVKLHKTQNYDTILKLYFVKDLTLGLSLRTSFERGRYKY